MKKKNKTILAYTIAASLLLNSFPYEKIVDLINNNAFSSVELTNEVNKLIKFRGANPVSAEIRKVKYEKDAERYVEYQQALFEEEIKENERIREYNDSLEHYSEIFHMDPELVVDTASDMTNNFTDDIDLCVGTESVSVNNCDQFSMTFVHELYYDNLEDIESVDYKVEKEKEFIERNEEDEIILSDGSTFDEYVEEISEVQEVDNTLVLAISNYETGYQTNDQSVYHNNFAGIRGTGTLPTPEAGIIHTVLTVKRISNLDGVNNMDDLSGVYVNGTKNKPSKTWVNAVNSIQKTLK